MWSHYEMGGDPGMAQMWQAQQEAERNRLRTEFKGSNCHVTPLSDAEQLFRALVLAKRPAGTQIARTKPVQEVLDSYKQIFAQPAPGSQVFFDAKSYELKYQLGQTPVTERVRFSWYLFQSETRDPSFYTFTQHAIVDAIQLEWFPDARATTDAATLEKIGRSIQFNPDWQTRVNAVRRKQAEQRKQQTDEAWRKRQVELKERDRLNDQNHRKFLQQIWQ